MPAALCDACCIMRQPHLGAHELFSAAPKPWFHRESVWTPGSVQGLLSGPAPDLATDLDNKRWDAARPHSVVEATWEI